MAPTIVAGGLNQSIHLVRKQVLSPLADRLACAAAVIFELRRKLLAARLTKAAVLSFFSSPHK